MVRVCVCVCGACMWRVGVHVAGGCACGRCMRGEEVAVTPVIDIRRSGANRTSCVSSAIRELAIANPEKFSPPALCVARSLETSPLAIGDPDSNNSNNPPHSEIPVRAGLGYIPSCHWPVYNAAVERFENLTSHYIGDAFGGDLPGDVSLVRFVSFLHLVCRHQSAR